MSSSGEIIKTSSGCGLRKCLRNIFFHNDSSHIRRDGDGGDPETMGVDEKDQSNQKRRRPTKSNRKSKKTIMITEGEPEVEPPASIMIPPQYFRPFIATDLLRTQLTISLIGVQFTMSVTPGNAMAQVSVCATPLHKHPCENGCTRIRRPGVIVGNHIIEFEKEQCEDERPEHGKKLLYKYNPVGRENVLSMCFRGLDVLITKGIGGYLINIQPILQEGCMIREVSERKPRAKVVVGMKRFVFDEENKNFEDVSEVEL